MWSGRITGSLGLAAAPWAASGSYQGLDTQQLLVAMVDVDKLHGRQTEIIGVAAATAAGPFIIETCD